MHKETDLYCIAFGCPKKVRDKDCQLAEIENLSFKEKLDWVDELVEKTRKSFLKHHRFCTKLK